jgi:hypothetical protein
MAKTSAAVEQVDSRFLRSRQPNQAILSKNDLTLLQVITSHALYANAQSELDKKIHVIPLSDLKRLINYRHKGNAHLQDILETLQSRKIHWGRLDDSLDEKQRWGSIPWLGPVIVDGGLVYYEYSETLKALLREATWTRLDLTILREFRRKHGLTLYTVGKKYQKVRTTGWKPLTWWLDLFDVNTEFYRASFGQLNKDVLRVAEREVNRLSDIKVEFLRRGRPVQHLKLMIYPNDTFVHPLDRQGIPIESKELLRPTEEFGPQDLGQSELQGIEEEYMAELNESFGVPLEKARQLLVERGIEVVADALIDLRNRHQSGFQPQVSWTAYAIGVLKQHQVVHRAQRTSVVTHTAKLEKEEHRRDLERRRQALATSYMQARKKAVADRYLELPPERKREVLAAFRAHLVEQHQHIVYPDYRRRLDPEQFDPNRQSGLNVLFDGWFVLYDGMQWPTAEEYLASHGVAEDASPQLSLLGDKPST